MSEKNTDRVSCFVTPSLKRALERYRLKLINETPISDLTIAQAARAALQNWLEQEGCFDNTPSPAPNKEVA